MTPPLLLLLAAAAASAVADVTVLRCCGPGETLNPNDAQGRCVALPSSELQDFVPVIYDVESSQFLAPNTEPPPYWNMVHERLPCQPAAEFLPASQPGSASGYVPFLNGSLWVQHLTGTLIDPGLFCLDRNGALVCRPEQPNKTKKCCGPAAVYSEQKMACEITGRHDAAGLPADVVSGFPRCEETAYAVSGHLNVTHWPVGPDWPATGGPLRPAAQGNGSDLHTRDYCLERVLEEQEPRTWTVFTCAPLHEPDHVQTKNYREDIRFTLYPLGLLLSAFFLAVTLVASCMLPSTYHVLHWKCQVNHVGCLLVGDLCLAFVQLSGDSLRGGPLCVFTGTCSFTAYIS